MRTMPRLSTAAATGAIAMPLYVLGKNWIVANFPEDELLRMALQLIWGLVAFYMPLILGTGMLARGRKSFQISFSREDIHKFYIPVWKRMGVFFVSAVISLLALQAAGVDF